MPAQTLTFVFPTKTTPVKAQMGHHSIQITVDTYGHLIPGANRQAVNRLAAMIENAPHTPRIIEGSRSGPVSALPRPTL
jgi:hypothetical protein